MSFHRIIHSLVTIVGSIYPIEIELKDTTDIAKTAMNTLDRHRHSQMWTKLTDLTDDFIFPIVNFPLTCSNIPAEPAYGVYIYRLI